MILVTGTIAYDQIFDIPQKFSDYIHRDKIHSINVSFTTEKLRKEFGGTGANQAYTLGLLKEKVYLSSSAGKDFSDFNTYLRKAGVNTSLVKSYKTELTSAGFVITDIGNNQIWGFSLGAGRFSESIPLVKQIQKFNPSMCLLAPNASLFSYAKACVTTKTPYVFDPAFYIPQIKPAELFFGVKNARIIFGNDYEIGLMKSIFKKNKLSNWETDQIWITTLGVKGSIVSYMEKGERIEKNIAIAKPKKVVDPTGAGDAFRAGFVAGYVKGYDLKTCGQMGATASSFVIEKYGTINHRFTVKEFWNRYRKNFGKTRF
jgi:adenosine kinase